MSQVLVHVAPVAGRGNRCDRLGFDLKAWRLDRAALLGEMLDFDARPDVGLRATIRADVANRGLVAGIESERKQVRSGAVTDRVNPAFCQKDFRKINLGVENSFFVLCQGVGELGAIWTV